MFKRSILSFMFVLAAAFILAVPVRAEEMTDIETEFTEQTDDPEESREDDAVAADTEDPLKAAIEAEQEPELNIEGISESCVSAEPAVMSSEAIEELSEDEEDDQEEAEEAEQEEDTSKKKKKKKKKKNYTDEDLKLLACLIYAEAGNQSYKGKLAVANVVLNRVKSDKFPNTVSDVIYQKTYSKSLGKTICQFSVCYSYIGTLEKALNAYGKRTKKIEIEAEDECIKAAKAAFSGKYATEEENYLFFCRYSKSIASRKTGETIGAHYFYK